MDSYDSLIRDFIENANAGACVLDNTVPNTTQYVENPVVRDYNKPNFIMIPKKKN